MIGYSMSSLEEEEEGVWGGHTCQLIQTTMGKKNAKDMRRRVTQRMGCWFLEKCFWRLDIQRQIGHMVHPLPYKASLITRNPFMRWLFACNATNMGLMRSTGAAWRRWRLPTITKWISENPDVLCIESDSAVGLLERCFIELCVVHTDLCPPKIFFELLSQCCVSNVFLAFSSHNSDRLIAILLNWIIPCSLV